MRGKKAAMSALLLSILALVTDVTTATTQPRVVVVTGQAAPGTNGGVLASVSRPSVNGLGDVAFQSNVSGSSVRNGIFLASGGSISKIALSGEMAPSGQLFSNFGLPALNDSRRIAFYARLGSGFDNQGVFLHSGTGTSAVALTGQTAPGTIGTLGVFDTAGVFLDNAGKIVFGATINGSEAGHGIFQHEAGGLRPVVLGGQMAPGTGGGRFLQFFGLAKNQTGQIAFLALITGGTAGNGVFLTTNGTVTAVAVEGQPAPYVGGGKFEFLRDPSLNDVGEVSFVDSTKPGTRFDPPSETKGLFLFSSGRISLVAAPNMQMRPGEPIPTRAFHLPSLVRTVNGNRILFVAFNETGRRGLLLWSEQRLIQLLQEGDPSPAGGVYSFIGNQVVESLGHFAFGSLLEGPTAQAGIFLDRIDLSPAFVTSLFFPRLVTDPNQSTGIAIVNLDTAAASLRFTAFDRSGSTVNGSSVSNPATRTLNAGSQIPIMDAQVFGEGLTSSRPVGWIKVESTVQKIAGFFLMLDPDLTVLDGADVSSRTLTSFVFPEIEATSDGFTQIHIANPNASSAQTILELVSADGSVRAKTERPIAANGSIADMLMDLFPGVTPSPSDYIRATASQGVVAFEFLGRSGRFAQGLNGQDSGATTLYSPQYVVGGPTWLSTLSVVNQDESSGTVTLRFIGNDGAVIGTQQRQIAPRGKLFISEQSFFSSAANQMQGYVEITSSGPRLAGSVVFGDQSRSTFSSALPLVANLHKEMIFGQVASAETSSPPWFTGLALLNAGSADVNAVVQVFDENGALVKSGNFVVPARRRLSQVLTQYFPDLAGRDILKGYIRVTSDQPLASFALFGTTSLSVLSAVPPQLVP